MHIVIHIMNDIEIKRDLFCIMLLVKLFNTADVLLNWNEILPIAGVNAPLSIFWVSMNAAEDEFI